MRGPGNGQLRRKTQRHRDTRQANSCDSQDTGGENGRRQGPAFLDLPRQQGIDRQLNAERAECNGGDCGSLKIAHLPEGTWSKSLDCDKHTHSIEHPCDQRQREIDAVLAARAGEQPREIASKRRLLFRIYHLWRRYSRRYSWHPSGFLTVQMQTATL